MAAVSHLCQPAHGCPFRHPYQLYNPAGWFEGVLACLYLLAMASGFFGLFLSRAIPKRLTTHGGEVLFERIPAIRRQFQEQAEKLALHR